MNKNALKKINQSDLNLLFEWLHSDCNKSGEKGPAEAVLTSPIEEVHHWIRQ